MRIGPLSHPPEEGRKDPRSRIIQRKQLPHPEGVDDLKKQHPEIHRTRASSNFEPACG